MRFEKDLERWGFKKTKDGVEPVTTLKPPASQAVLTLSANGSFFISVFNSLTNAILISPVSFER